MENLLCWFVLVIVPLAQTRDLLREETLARRSLTRFRKGHEDNRMCWERHSRDGFYSPIDAHNHFRYENLLNFQLSFEKSWSQSQVFILKEKNLIIIIKKQKNNFLLRIEQPSQYCMVQSATKDENNLFMSISVLHCVSFRM